MQGLNSNGQDQVSNFFSYVPNRRDDTRMVYNTTSSGLNDAVSAP